MRGIWTIVAAAAALGACGGSRNEGVPSLPAGAFQARGEDPRWALSVGPDSIVYIDETNRVQVSERNPGRVVPREGRLATRRIVLDTTARACTLPSGATYAQTVQVTVDGLVFRGCGGALSVDQLNGTSWTVLSVNGRPTTAGVHTARFANGQLLLQLGCYRASAPFTTSGQTLTAGALSRSAGSCPEAEFSANAEKALGGPLSIERIGTDQLILRNQFGSLALLKSTS